MEDNKITIPDALSIITPAQSQQQSSQFNAFSAPSASLLTDSKKQNKPGIKYGNIMQIPVMEAPEGIRYDFNHGMRIYFPKGDKKYHLKFGNAGFGGRILHAEEAEHGREARERRWHVEAPPPA